MCHQQSVIETEDIRGTSSHLSAETASCKQNVAQQSTSTRQRTEEKPLNTDSCLVMRSWQSVTRAFIVMRQFANFSVC